MSLPNKVTEFKDKPAKSRLLKTVAIGGLLTGAYVYGGDGARAAAADFARGFTNDD
jgi:hypothetical protein